MAVPAAPNPGTGADASAARESISERLRHSLIRSRTFITAAVLVIFAGVTAPVLLYAGLTSADPFDRSMQVLAIVAPFVTLTLGFWFGSAQADKAQQEVDETKAAAAKLVAEVDAAPDAEKAQTLERLRTDGSLRRLL